MVPRQKKIAQIDHGSKKVLCKTPRDMVLIREALKSARYQSVTRAVKPDADKLPLLPNGQRSIGLPMRAVRAQATREFGKASRSDRTHQFGSNGARS